MITTLPKHLLRFLGVVGMLLLLAAPTQAQNSQFTCTDATDRLDCSRIQAAAKPLIDRGAEVAVYMVSRGDSSGADFIDRLRADDFASGDTIDGELIAVYVSLDPRYAEIRGGDRWNAALLPNDNITTIRTTKLVPALAAGKFTDGFVDTLAAIDTSIASPPQSGTSAQPPALGGGGTDTRPLAWSVFGVAALAGGGYAAFRGRKAWKAWSEARWFAEDAKQTAGEAIVELDRALEASRAKAEYDRLSYAAADVAQLAAIQQSVETQFTQVQTDFTAVGERLGRHARPPLADYQTAASGYTAIKQRIVTLRAQLATNDATRQQLDTLATQVPAAIEQAKAQLQTATDLLGPLAAVIANSEGVLAPIREQIAQAEAAFANHDARQALVFAQTTAALTANLGTTVEQYGTLQGCITQLHDEAAVLQRQGYNLAESHAALMKAQTALDAGAAALERAGSEAAMTPLAAVAPLLEQARTNGRGLLAQRAANDQRLLDLGVRARTVAALLVDAHAKFDIVDEFAESTWSDIRGNGSEAEKAAAEAEAMWQQALERNRVDQGAFVAARDDLNTVEAALARATSLCQAITGRLADLEHARAIAQEELAAAASDVELGTSFIGQHDADIGANPEAQIAKAAQLLAQAQTEARNSKPDWLALVRLAQAANAEADGALVGGRSEVEAMDKLRGQIEHARQLAASEIQRAERFHELHRGDISWSSVDSLQSLRSQLYQAGTALQEAEQLQEEERRAALQRAHSQFTSAESRAGQVYATFYQEFQRAEAARRAAEEEEARRRSSSNSSSSWGSSSSSHSYSSHSSSSSSGSSSGGSWGGGSKSGGGW